MCYYYKIDDYKYNGNRLSVSYKASLTKMTICIICFATIIASIMWQQTHIFPDFMYILAFFFSSIMFINAISEIGYTLENRRFLKLKKLNKENMNSTKMVREVILQIIQNNTIFCVIMTPSNVFRIGSEHITKRPPEETQRYYIDEITNEKIHRSVYKNFDQFIGILDRINGNDIVFNVVYWADYVDLEGEMKSRGL